MQKNNFQNLWKKYSTPGMSALTAIGSVATILAVYNDKQEKILQNQKATHSIVQTLALKNDRTEKARAVDLYNSRVTSEHKIDVHDLHSNSLRMQDTWDKYNQEQDKIDSNISNLTQGRDLSELSREELVQLMLFNRDKNKNHEKIAAHFENFFSESNNKFDDIIIKLNNNNVEIVKTPEGGYEVLPVKNSGSDKVDNLPEIKKDSIFDMESLFNFFEQCSIIILSLSFNPQHYFTMIVLLSFYISTCLFNIFTVFYANFFILKFENFTKFCHIIKYRQEHKKYTISLNILGILLALFIIFYKYIF